MCDNFIAEKKVDFVALGRQLIADPYWVQKVENGNPEQIRKCFSCNDGCIGKLMTPLEIRCAINPLVGKEHEFKRFTRAVETKDVLVIGSGPAGIQAAITASQRGHRVTLIEKSDRIGGQLNIASRTPHKLVVGRFIDWGSGELARQNVTVISGTTATLEKIKELSPDHVIVATGSTPLMPGIPGAHHAISSWEILGENAESIENQAVSIIGGGIVGCEVAHLLAENNNKVTIFELLAGTATGLESSTKFDLISGLRQLKVDINTQTTVKEISSEGVHFENAEGKQFLASDTIIMSIGQKSERNDLVENIKRELNIPARYIGDAQNVGKVLNAVSEGFHAGFAV